MMNYHQSDLHEHDSLPMSEINVTPLVDIMLVLLIIFMVTSPMLLAGVEIDLPDTVASPLTQQQKPLSITVNKEGLIYLQDQKITLASLHDKLVKLKNGGKPQTIMIRGDQQINYGTVMEVIGVVNRAGHHQISLVSDVDG